MSHYTLPIFNGLEDVYFRWLNSEKKIASHEFARRNDFYGNNGNDPRINAIEHAYSSAQLAYQYGGTAATALGNAKESFAARMFGADPIDTWIDQWNNSIGRQIGAWAKAHGYGQRGVDELLAQAVRNGHLMTPERYASLPTGFIDLNEVPSPEWIPPAHQHSESWFEGIPFPPLDPVERWIHEHWDRLPHAFWEAVRNAAEAIDASGEWITDLFGHLVDRYDPFTLDLDGNGIGLIDLASSSAQFDLNGDGFAERTGWVSPGDGLLVLDRDANGIIDNIGELFGSAEVDAYTMLREEDANGDGVISGGDPVYGSLRIWRDANHDGISQSAELASLSELGIASIGLDAAEAGDSVAGNLITHRGSFTYSNGASGETGAVWFATDQVNTRYQLPEGFEFDPEVFALPNLRGYGRVPDLWVAMTLDPELKQMVKELVAAGGTLTSLDQVIGNVLGGEVDSEGGALGEGGTAWATFHGRPLPGYEPDSFERMIARWANVVEVPQGSEFNLSQMFGVYITSGSGGGSGYSASTTLMMGNITLVNQALSAFLNRPISNFAVGNFSYYEAFHQFSTNLAVRFYVQVPELAVTAALLDFSEALRMHPPADGVSYSEEEYQSYFAPILQAFDNPPPMGPAVQALMGLDYEFGQDRIVGDPSALIVHLLEELDVDPEEPWNGYDVWYKASEPYLEAAGVDQTTLERALRRHTGNTALEILRAPHQELAGTSGNDQLSGDAAGASRDLLTGRGGDDLLTGGAGSDTYVFGDGSGADTIVDASGTGDEIAFQGGLTSTLARYAFADANRFDLLISFEGRPEKVIVRGYFGSSGNATIEKISFPDGPVADHAAIRAQVMAGLATVGNDVIAGFAEPTALVGLGGDDSLTGGAATDTLTGGTGNDLLSGKDGADSYIFARGDGQDRIAESNSQHDYGGTDRLVFAPGISFEDLIVGRPAGAIDDLVIAIAGTSDAITIAGHDRLYMGRFYDEIEQFVFRSVRADGSVAETVYTSDQIQALRLIQAATAADDTIVGSRRADLMTGLAGNDVLQGREGDDRLEGDTGNDLLKGGGGNDSYVFALGDGQDRIFEEEDQFGWGGNDRLVFAPGITLDSLILSRPNAQDILIQIGGTGDSILLDDNDVSYQGRYFNRIESFVFQTVQADGSIVETVVTSAELNARLIGQAVTEGNDNVTGSSYVDEIDARGGNDIVRGLAGNDLLAGGAGNDRIEGGAGDDVYRFGRGDGQDSFFEAEDQFGWGSVDRIRFGPGIAPADLLFGKSAASRNDLTIAIAGTADSILIKDQDLVYQGRTYNRIEYFVFQTAGADGGIVETVLTEA